MIGLFDVAPVVAFGEAHWVREQHDLIGRLLLDPRISTLLDAIVVEFGNARYQPLVDTFVAGNTVAPSQLRCVWSDTVGGARSRVFESPVYAEFFELARTAVARGAHFRVLLGDPPSHTDGRDRHFAAVVTRQVIAHGRTALLLAGGGHLARLSDVGGGNVVQRLERDDPGCCVVVMPHYVFPDVAARRERDLAELEDRLACWPSPSLAAIDGTWLQTVDATLLLDDRARRINADGSTSEVKVTFCDNRGFPVDHVHLGEVADAYLYLGPTASLTLARPTGEHLV